ncbi:hypothetical protein IQ06DRAFT_305276 [Phaeosphaeriaceae sp. SRC1lsM3a]|nr:hypothetical protein IQ06DRAFT_305276 [Stagonospora sp. SRC1lsM3a]
MKDGDVSAPPSTNSTVSAVIDRQGSQHAVCDVGDTQKASSDCAQETTLQLCMDDSNTPQSYASSIYSDHTSSGYMTASSSSSQQAPPLECSKCKDAFKRPCDLNCQQPSFGLKTDLKRHMRTVHCTTGPFSGVKCIFNGCSRMFTREDNMRRHARQHASI